MQIDIDTIINTICAIFLFSPFLIGIISGIISALYQRTQRSINKKAKIKIDNEIQKIYDEKVSQLEHQLKELEHIKNEKSLKIKHQIESIKKLEKKLEQSPSQEYPYLSESISEYLYLADMEVASYLERKIRPAHATAYEIKYHIAQEKKKYKRESIAYKNQLEFYEYLFPWLVDFKELPPKEAIEYAKDPEKAYAQANDKYWLSPEEYSQLNSAQRSQLALDRWKKRKRSNWEAGIEYEQYIGYYLESNGYRVKYQGANLGLEDMGIDLIAYKKNELWVIQCKRWNQNKTIHEKHIFQLYGTKVLKEIQFPEKDIYALFVITEDNLSDLAKECAKRLGVHVRIKPYVDYPMIKCNINNGEKIYHLPMDQQYNRIVIETSKGEFYAWTAEEAEKKGFRRAIPHNFHQ